MKSIFASITLLIFVNVSAQEDDTSSVRVGPDKAVTEFSTEKGFMLSKKAFEVLEIKTQKLSGTSTFDTDKNAIVYYQDKIGIYRLRNERFKLVPITIIKKIGEQVTIYSTDLSEGDQIAIRGAGLLRVTEMDITAGQE